jgi:hypothetical protein
MLPTKTAMEVNAATSRMISVMSVSLFLYVCSLFFSCSSVKPKKAKAHAGTNSPVAVQPIRFDEVRR